MNWAYEKDYGCGADKPMCVKWKLERMIGRLAIHYIQQSVGATIPRDKRSAIPLTYSDPVIRWIKGIWVQGRPAASPIDGFSLFEVYLE